ncbi:hypothetical protein LTR50_001150 [Elasticomyces elasticus]|nr:hypothetical protein LTR50_001150 [Elasticomyces elasticus]
MARTNSELTFAEVKRRFVRQNRELAKNNSGQSLRIRVLETETSRQLAENLELREQIIQLQKHLADRQTQTATSAVDIKTLLEAKIHELGSLVAEIGVLRKPEEIEGRRTSLGPDVSRRERPVRPPRATLAEATGQESRMPTIMEDKYFPRRTLDAEEVRALRLSDQSNESPDLGPPPVAHFECDDPIKFDPAVRENRPDSQTRAEDAELLPTTLSVNLETRRKRKDLQPKLEIRRTSLAVVPPQEPDEVADDAPAQPLRTSAKRKLSVRDADDALVAIPKGDFRFSRKSVLLDAKEARAKPAGSGKTTPEITEQPDENERVQALVPKTERKVLGDKSVNLSPRKVSGPLKDVTRDPKKVPSLKPTDRSQMKNEKTSPTKPIQVPMMQETPIEETIELGPTIAEATTLPPKTPASLDLFSPASSTEPSVARPEGRDTPPPADLHRTTSTSDQNGAARPSRRARTAVNYAEPSLIIKMRRPTKDFADAVGKDGRALSVQPPPREGSAPTETARLSKNAAIKDEETPESSWRDLPTRPVKEPPSPLDQRSSSALSPMRPTETEIVPEVVTSKSSKSSSAAAISALTANGRRERTALPQRSKLQDVQDGFDRLDVYDFSESSPADTSNNVKETKNNAARARSGRRHSSVPSNPPATNKTAIPSVRTNSVAKDASATRETKEVKHVKSTTGTGLGRSERAAARRRSMLL